MKKLLLLACISLFGTQTYAQKKPAKFNYFAASTLDSIGATNEQKSQVRELVKSYGEKNAAIWKDGSLSDEEKRLKVKANKRAQSKEYYSVLTQDQKIKLKAYKVRFDQRQ